MSLSRERLLALIAESRKKLEEQRSGTGTPLQSAVHHVPQTSTEVLAAQIAASETVVVRNNPDYKVESVDTGRIDATSDASAFQWNAEQLDAIELARGGKSFCLIGAAGTGKTTTEKEIARILVAENKVPPISFNTKYLKKGLPGIVFTSFTRRAVRNMKRVVSADLQPHCITLHKLLEYEPQFYEVWDNEAGKNRVTMRFEPGRNKLVKLPDSVRTIVIDESSMVSTELFAKLLEALPNHANVQFIFVGDLHQLPPVYGQAILGFKLLDLPTVELTRIYRQAAKSPIISLAHQIKNGEDIPLTEKRTLETEQGKITLHPWKKPLSDFDGTRAASLFIKKLVSEGDYDEEEDIILCPQEKTKNTAFGTNEFNRVVAHELAQKRKAEVYEVVAGYVRHYLAVGDRLLVGREDAIVIKITKNAKYWGKRPRPASKDLDRWGNYAIAPVQDDSGEDFDADAYLEQFTLDTSEAADNEEKKQECSHIIDVELLDSGAQETLSTAGEINAVQFAYCLTVHKSQGSEWNRVFFLTHQSHVVQWSRELLYTAVTRARKELYCIIEPDRGAKKGTLWKAAISPRIKGDTLAEKALYFQGKSADWEERLEEVNRLPRGQGQVVEGKYQGEEPAPIVPFVAPKPPAQLLRLCDYVPEEFKKLAEEALAKTWARARLVWGDSIGKAPLLNYNLQRSKIIGLASYGDHSIYLNPLWCIGAMENAYLLAEMLNDTIPHEVAHFVNHFYASPRGKGHDGGWLMAGKLLGMKNPQVTAGEWPSWAANYETIVGGIKLRLATEHNGIIEDHTEDLTNVEA